MLGMIERHHDQILVIPSIPAGGEVRNVPLAIDTDAPFLVRGRGLRVTPPVSRSQVQVRELRFRYTNQAGAYLAQQPIQTQQDFGQAFGQGGNYRPVYPQQPYPPGGTILVDVINDSGADVTNLQCIFRGVKLFRDGALPAPTYPPKCRALDFTYQTGKGTSQDPALILATTSQLIQQPFNVRSDADFALRAAQAGLWTYDGSGTYSPIGYTELYVQLFDGNLKPYSNVPIHIDYLFGAAQGTGQGTYDFELGNSAPGLFVPEIYLPKNSVLFYNLIRNDAAYTGVTDSLPVRISMAWIGSKVYGSAQ